MSIRTGLAAVLLIVATASAATAQSSLRPGCRVVNRSRAPIQAVQAAPSGMPDWSGNKLEGRPIPPGQDRDLKLATETNCLFDIRATFAGGATQDRHHVDVCKHQDAVFDGGGSDGTTK